jgi:hypothetical protein
VNEMDPTAREESTSKDTFPGSADMIGQRAPLHRIFRAVTRLTQLPLLIAS